MICIMIIRQLLKKILVHDDMLSHSCKELKEKDNISSGKVKKLVPNLIDKEKCLTLQKFAIISKTRFATKKDS